MLLCPANTLSNPALDKPSDLSVLPIDEITMPEESVSDLKDVFDAINKLCDTMNTSQGHHSEEELNTNIVGSEADPNIVAEIHPSAIEQYALVTSNYSQMIISEVSEYETNLLSECDSSTLVASENDSTMIASTIDTSMLASEIFSSMFTSQNDNIAQELPDIDTDVIIVEYRDFHKESTEKAPEVYANEEQISQKIQEVNTERWSDAMSHLSLQDATVTSDTTTAQCEAGSEVYYTASSEVSLLSDSELPEKDGNYVIAGHVAAMRERFESMTRTNTPCPDLIRSLSPSLEVFRNTSPSPDRMA